MLINIFKNILKIYYTLLKADLSLQNSEKLKKFNMFNILIE